VSLPRSYIHGTRTILVRSFGHSSKRREYLIPPNACTPYALNYYNPSCGYRISTVPRLPRPQLLTCPLSTHKHPPQPDATTRILTVQSILTQTTKYHILTAASNSDPRGGTPTNTQTRHWTRSLVFDHLTVQLKDVSMPVTDDVCQRSCDSARFGETIHVGLQ
jgi:hypothetical protein